MRLNNSMLNYGFPALCLAMRLAHAFISFAILGLDKHWKIPRDAAHRVTCSSSHCNMQIWGGGMGEEEEQLEHWEGRQVWRLEGREEHHS